MKLFGSGLFGQAIRAAGVGAALMLSVSAGHAQSGPFAGFDGSWAGNGTVTLSDGASYVTTCVPGMAPARTEVIGNGRTGSPSRRAD